MFDKYLIDAATVRNLGPADAPTGFSFQARLGYYRGLGLSMVEDLAIVVDDTPIDRQTVAFDDGMGALSLAEMETAFDRRWEFGAAATITVALRGGLTAGEHKLALTERLRISYLPFPLMAADEKRVTAL